MRCQVASCEAEASHRSGWGNGDREQGPPLNCCIPHTNERENDGAWSRSLDEPTYRERREARADRLRGWAEKREAKAEAALEQARTMADMIPFGQPILVGHYSEGRDRRYRDRIGSTFERSLEHAEKARSMTGQAATIESQLDRSIYSDDPDAAERLEERIAELEAERDRIKAYNASCRKAAKSGGAGDLTLLDDDQRADIQQLAKVCAWQVGAGGAFPAYKLSNLSGNIKRNRDRLAALRG